MRPDQRVSLKIILWAGFAGLMAVLGGVFLVAALSSGEIEGRSGRVYTLASDAGGFIGLTALLVFYVAFWVAAAIYVLWVRPQAVRGEVILTRRLVVRSDLDTAARASLDPTRPSTDG
ncbi:MAG: hypothetical protein REJ23_09645 [Brevundimonas sp.]|nr:hypothetical protein [Brevundimonas sp.]